MNTIIIITDLYFYELTLLRLVIGGLELLDAVIQIPIREILNRQETKKIFIKNDPMSPNSRIPGRIKNHGTLESIVSSEEIIK